MLALSLKRIYRVCNKVIVRNIRNRRFENVERVGPNPGLDKRLQSFQKEGLQVSDDAEEFIEESHSDFANVGEVYNEHLNETLIGKYKLRHRIVKDKYFKENMPNLLTWSEKEQIRHLATTEPDEWTPERLAESFPITAQVAKRLLKYPWKPADERRIARHDASAMRNWKELKEGTLDIPNELRLHFLKFSNRTIPPLNKKSIKIDLEQERKMGEFESIIKRCATTENKENSKENDLQVGEASGPNQNQNKIDNDRVTLEQLKLNIKNRLQNEGEVDLPDQFIAESVASAPPSNSLQASHEVELSNYEEDSKQLTHFKEQNDEKSLIYPERIRIPKKAYKRGATYKVNDCYYDHDGRFLYRVIGI